MGAGIPVVTGGASEAAGDFLGRPSGLFFIGSHLISNVRAAMLVALSNTEVNDEIRSIWSKNFQNQYLGRNALKTF